MIKEVFQVEDVNYQKNSGSPKEMKSNGNEINGSEYKNFLIALKAINSNENIKCKLQQMRVRNWEYITRFLYDR